LQPVARSGRPQALWFTGTLALVAVQGLLRLYDPFDGDQALFLLGARALDAGGRLYVEFWDNKQPGIYWFYWLGGRLFGFTEEGVRAFEILWVLGLAAVLMAWLGRALVRPWLAAAAALAACNSYFALAPHWALGQLEMLVGLPAALSAWLLCAGMAERQPVLRALPWLAAGACGGIAAVFKVVLAPIFAALAVAAALLPSPASAQSPRLARVARDVAAYGAGALLPLLAVVAVFAGQEALRPLLETTFLYPLEALGEVPLAPVRRLLESLAWIAAALAPWLPFVVIGARPARAAGAGERPAAILALVWLTAGLVVIVVQKFSWWAYHLWLVAVPAAALAAVGLDRLCVRIASLPGALRPGVIAALIVVTAAATTALPTVRRVSQLAWHARAGALDLASYRREQSDEYATIADSVRLLPPDDRAPIYVFGNPLYCLLSARAPAIAVHGWAWGLMPKRLWRRLPAMLDAARPARIFVAFADEKLVRFHAPEVLDQIERDYRREREDGLGTWFVRTDAAAGAPMPEASEAPPAGATPP
jgi:4-amino-4-deoxy-L-arabinose transferase-like glycosyltransferase